MSWKRFAIPALVWIAAILAQGQVRNTTAPPTPQNGSNTAAQAPGGAATSGGGSSSGGTVTGWRTPGINAPRPVTQAAAQMPLAGTQLPPAGASQTQPQQPVTQASANQAVQPPLVPVSAAAARGPIARVTRGNGTLPNDAGQEWRDYDISPYTARVTSTNQPEQAIRDWILRETGYEAWHGDVIALLCANRRTLSVYHTPEMHAVVQEMVDRFVNTEAESYAFGMRVITLDSPNWRTKAHAMLRPVAAQTPGVQAWLMAKEDAALLLNDLARRSDFQEHSTPHLVVNNGQSTVVAKTRARNYVRDVLTAPGRGLAGLRTANGTDRRGIQIRVSPALVARRRHHRRSAEVRSGPGGKNAARANRRPLGSRPAADDQDRSTANHQFADARAISLAGRPGVVDQPGRWPHAGATGHRRAERAAVLVERPGRSAGICREPGKIKRSACIGPAQPDGRQQVSGAILAGALCHGRALACAAFLSGSLPATSRVSSRKHAAPALD